MMTSRSLGNIMREAAQKPTADPNRLLADTLKSWAEKFPTSEQAVEDDKAQAPFLEKHGSTALAAYWDQWSPAAHCLHEGLPSLAALVTKTYLFGYMPVLYGYDFEPDALRPSRSCSVACRPCCGKTLPTALLRQRSRPLQRPRT